jgi:hypothetical protein
MSVSRSIEQPAKRKSSYYGWVIVTVAFSLRSPLREMKGQTFTSRLSCFLFRPSRTGTFEFNSTTSSRDRRAGAQGAQLGQAV